MLPRLVDAYPKIGGLGEAGLPGLMSPLRRRIDHPAQLVPILKAAVPRKLNVPPIDRQRQEIIRLFSVAAVDN